MIWFPKFHQAGRPIFLANNNIQLGSGNSNIIFNFHPENWGRWSILTCAYFSKGWFNHQEVFYRKYIKPFSKHPYNFEKNIWNQTKIPPQIIRFILPLFSKPPFKKKSPLFFLKKFGKKSTYLPPPFRCGRFKRKIFWLVELGPGQAFSSRSCQGRRKKCHGWVF